MTSLPPVIFEDECLIAFDKPAGLAVAAERGHKPGEHLMAAVQEKMGRDVSLVHRIEADASGLVLCAKTKVALDFLSGQFQSKTAGRRYEALTVGVPSFATRASRKATQGTEASEGRPTSDEFTVDLVMKEDEAKPGVMCVVKKHGLTSVTAFTVLEKFPQPAGRPSLAHVECRPQTGRTHQIRLHLQVSGTPILNDSIYGDATQLLLSDLKRGYKGRDDERPLITRLALHAAGLTFKHPVSREMVTLAAPLPKDFAVALKYLQKFAR